jgi:PKD repeat protein
VAAVAADGATDHWSLGEASGNTAFADIGGNDLTVGSGVTRGEGGAVTGDPDTASTFDGTETGFGATARSEQAPGTFSVEAWFRTTSAAGGKIVGFGNANTGTSATYDRHVYMDTSGRVLFGVTETNQRRTIQSRTGFNDGDYHHVVATLGTGGMALYVDGVRVATRASTTVGPNYYGYWRVGGDSTWSGSQWFNGRIDEVAVYPGVLSQPQIAGHYALGIGGGVVNQPPSASFTATTTDLDVAVNASASTDSDGTIANYSWNWGDSTPVTSGAGATASHRYATGGNYTITLTVTDDDGATGTTTRPVTVTAPPVNEPPVAEFSSTANGLDVAFNGAASSEAGGSIAQWSWDFGDTSDVVTETDATVSHTFPAAGSYTVTLTVTDDDGEADSVAHEVTVSDAPGPAVLASDTFQRNATNGLGSAEVGGPWTVQQSSGARQSVTPGAAAMTLPAATTNTGSFLGNVSTTSVDVRTSFTVDVAPTGNGTYVYVTGRRVSNNNEYRARVRLLADGRVALALSRLTSATTPIESFPGGEVIVPGLTYTVGQNLNVRVQVSGTGTTQIGASVWPAGGTEPATPSMVRSDTTAVLQAAGSVGLLVHRPSGTTAATTVRFTSFSATAGP